MPIDSLDCLELSAIAKSSGHHVMLAALIKHRMAIDKAPAKEMEMDKAPAKDREVFFQRENAIKETLAPIKTKPQPTFLSRATDWVRRHPILTTLIIALIVGASMVATLGISAAVIGLVMGGIIGGMGVLNLVDGNRADKEGQKQANDAGQSKSIFKKTSAYAEPGLNKEYSLILSTNIESLYAQPPRQKAEHSQDSSSSLGNG